MHGTVKVDRKNTAINKTTIQTVPRKAEQSLKSRFSGKEVLAFLDEDDLEEEEDGDMGDTFFPGSDEELACEVDTRENEDSEEEM